MRGKQRVDDRRLISGILHVLRSGCRWKDCFAWWAERGVCERLFSELAKRGRLTATQMIDSTHVKAHRSASGARKGANRARRLAAHEAGAIRRSRHWQMLEAVFFPSS